MKNRLNNNITLLKVGFLLHFVLLFIACAEKSDECIYSKNTFIDTTLSVTFKINGKDKKFYQIQPLDVYNWSSGKQIKLNDSINIVWFNYQINFVSFTEKNIPNGYTVPEFALYFSKKMYINKKINYSNKSIPKLNEVFVSKLNFSCIPENLELKDTILMDGVSVEWTNYSNNEISLSGPSTDNIFKYYNYNKDSVNLYLNDRYYFEILKTTIVCNNIYIVEGKFKVKLLISPTNPSFIELIEGKFKFIKQ